MHNNKYLNVAPRSLTNSKIAGTMEDTDRRIKNRIEELRNEGYTEDDIFLMIIEENSKHDSMGIENKLSNKNTKAKCYTYVSDFLKK